MTVRMVRAFAFVAALAAAVASADVAPGSFGVGVLRRDGIIIPFASFDGRKWRSDWPAPKLDLTVPVSLSAVPSRWWGPTPPLSDWQVRTADGPRTLHVVQPDWVDIHCVRQIGLRTDYHPDLPPPPPAAQPYPKDGLAVAPPQPIEPIAILPPSGAEARSAIDAVQASFNEAERRTEDRFGHPIARRAREGVAPTIEALYAYGSDPRVFYVEATRTYRELGQQQGDCTAIGVGSGWFVGDARGFRKLVMTVDVLNCRRATASYMLPLGAIRLNGRIYWLAQFSGSDHERYVVLEIKEQSVEVVVNAWGGAC